MNVNIKISVNSDNNSLKEYLKNKITRLEKHYNHIKKFNVILKIENKYQHKAEAELHILGNKNKITANSISENMYSSIDMLISKLDKQIIKFKEKNQHSTL
ncbi:MAG: ribosome-associated translation inhibitor RaiA [Candidatus Azosocius agrarius]|nr:MAG: ribosome-associated translation inhibitor RaiA [Gammaproteobacteria bacterium]